MDLERSDAIALQDRVACGFRTSLCERAADQKNHFTPTGLALIALLGEESRELVQML